MTEVTHLRSSALDAYLGKPIESNGICITIIPNVMLHQVAVWPETLDRWRETLLQSLGASKTLSPSQIASKDDKTLIWIEPLKFWVLHHPVPEIPADQGATLDQSHAFVHLRLSGTDVTTHLNKFLSLDLRETSFADQATAMSDIHHVAVRIWREGADYHLLVPRGFALSVFELIKPQH